MEQPTFTLWECPPLRARLTRRQCVVNRARAESPVPSAARRFDASTLPAGRHECLACQGVAWWAERTGRGPREVQAVELLEALAEKDAQRRRMGGVEDGAEAAQRAEGQRRRRRSAAATIDARGSGGAPG